MRIIADLQIHSKYSRATSKDMDLEHIAEGAKLKGLSLVGTGDCTFPAWIKELKEKLEPINTTGIYTYRDIFWMITGEVNTVYEQDHKMRKVHHLFYLPGIEVAEQLNEILSKKANLSADGRPTLNRITSPEFVEMVVEISKEAIVMPAHAWTSWFGALGGMSGFDSLEECYRDQMKNIFALETGLSSDPLINWRISGLDKVTLMSNSDSHSPNPWRLGREANVFELEKLTYKEIYDIIKKKDLQKFLFTIETPPEYGKYHYSGHRNCDVSFHPSEAKKMNNICPKCKRKFTIGVLQRVEELADRPEGFIPKTAIPFKSLLPLYEIISYASGINQLYSKKVIEEQNKLVNRFGNELTVLLETPKNDLIKVTNEKIANIILANREGKINIIAGFDGLYGKVVNEQKITMEYKKQHSLEKFLKR